MAYIEENELIANRYKLIRKLGSGAYSEVWEAIDQKISEGPKVALKIYEPELGLDQLFIDLFSKEFSNTLNLNHPNILTPKHFDVFQGSPFLILPFCKNGSLKKQIKSEGPLQEESIIKVFTEIGSALCYLHEHEPTLIHQDIKPDNIMINDTTDFLLSDFGICTLWHTTNKFTSGKEFMFTRPYAPPEKFGLHPMVSPAVDIFAFGVTIHELVTSEVPWDGEGGLALLKGEKIPDLPDTISSEINDIIKTCLSALPEERPKAKDLVIFAKNLKKRKYSKDTSLYTSYNTPIKLDKPILSYPYNLLTDLSFNVRFSWKSVEYAHDYVLQISGNAEFTNIIEEIPNISATFHEIRFSSSNTEFFWRIKARRMNLESEWSEIWKFVTHKDNYKTISSLSNYEQVDKVTLKKKNYSKTELYSIIAISLFILVMVYFLISNLLPRKTNPPGKELPREYSGISLNKPSFERTEQIFKAESSINTTPLINDSIIFFGSRDHKFYAFDFKNKILKWEYMTGGPIQSSPAKDTSLIFFGSHDMNFYALDLKNGKLKWKFSTGNVIESPPVIYNNSVYFGCDDGFLYSLNKENGTLNWKFETKNKIFAKPVVIRELIYIGSLDSNLYIISTDGKLQNSIHARGGIFSTLDSHKEGFCFGDDSGILYFFSTDENKCIWTFDSKGSIYSSPKILDNSIFFGNNNGYFYCVNLKTGTPRWNPIQTNGKIISTPVIDKEVVYFGSADSSFYGLNKTNGKIKTLFKTESSILCSPIMLNNNLFFGSSDGFLYQINK